MLFESAHVRVAAEYGTATLAFAFPGHPVNGLDLARLRELDAALAAVERNPFLDILVIRSANPAGFCAGLRPEAVASLPTAADRAAFAAAGQRVFARLAGLPMTTVAFIDGPCLGAGLELALACDHRLVLSRPSTHLGFPGGPPWFGGTARLRALVGRRAADRLIASGETLSGRQSLKLGIADHAFCDRRGKIELRTFLDRLERRGWRPKSLLAPAVEDAAERRAFAHSPPAAVSALVLPPTVNPIPPFPAVVGLIGDDPAASRLAAEVALRGGEVVVYGSGDRIRAGIATSLARGFVTPLEADQANARVKVGGGFDRAGLILASGGREPPGGWAGVRPRCVVAVVSDQGRRPLATRRRPSGTPESRAAERRRPVARGASPWTTSTRLIGLRLTHSSADIVPFAHTDADAVAALAAWMGPFGYAVAVTPAPAARRLAA